MCDTHVNGMPIATTESGECPGNAGHGYAWSHMRIFDDIKFVVITDKLVTECL